MDDLQCQCGNNNWDGDWDNPKCSSCHTGPYTDGRRHTTTHVARKSHKTWTGEEIRPGDKYRRVVQFGYYPDGASTLQVTKTLLEKGSNWPVAEVMES
jgi:hypothetical protein